jgi:hypothetical protein
MQAIVDSYRRIAALAGLRATLPCEAQLLRLAGGFNVSPRHRKSLVGAVIADDVSTEDEQIRQPWPRIWPRVTDPDVWRVEAIAKG